MGQRGLGGRAHPHPHSRPAAVGDRLLVADHHGAHPDRSLLFDCHFVGHAIVEARKAGPEGYWLERRGMGETRRYEPGKDRGKRV